MIELTSPFKLNFVFMLQEEVETAGGKCAYGACFVDTSVAKFHVSRRVYYISNITPPPLPLFYL